LRFTLCGSPPQQDIGLSGLFHEEAHSIVPILANNLFLKTFGRGA